MGRRLREAFGVRRVHRRFDDGGVSVRVLVEMRRANQLSRAVLKTPQSRRWREFRMDLRLREAFGVRRVHRRFGDGKASVDCWWRYVGRMGLRERC